MLCCRGRKFRPPSVFVTSLWALVTLDGEPVAFISPDEVQDLAPDRPVAAFLDDLVAAYVADIAEPTPFFRQRLGRRQSPHSGPGRHPQPRFRRNGRAAGPAEPSST